MSQTLEQSIDALLDGKSIPDVLVEALNLAHSVKVVLQSAVNMHEKERLDAASLAMDIMTTAQWIVEEMRGGK